MGVISQNGIDYPVPSVPVQSDGSATDLTNAAVPTGQTIKSYLNSNFGTFITYTGSGTYIQTYTVKFFVIGKVVFYSLTFVTKQDISSSTADTSLPNTFPTVAEDSSASICSADSNVLVNGQIKIKKNHTWVALGVYFQGTTYAATGVCFTT